MAFVNPPFPVLRCEPLHPNYKKKLITSFTHFVYRQISPVHSAAKVRIMRCINESLISRWTAAVQREGPLGRTTKLHHNHNQSVEPPDERVAHVDKGTYCRHFNFLTTRRGR